MLFFFFFFNDTATTEIYTYGHTLSRHDALPISIAPPMTAKIVPPPIEPSRTCVNICAKLRGSWARMPAMMISETPLPMPRLVIRSEEHTSELQSLMRISYAVFCLKKKKKTNKLQYRSALVYILIDRSRAL